VQRLIVLLLTCLLLAACAGRTRMPAPAVQLPPLRLAPSALAEPLQLQQKLQFRFGPHQRELDALLEADASMVRLAVQAMGQTGVTLQWDGTHLQQKRAPWLPPQVRGERVLDDLQFALWPLPAIRAALPAGWSVDEVDGVRRLRQGDRDWLLLEHVDPGHQRLRNLAEGYELDILSINLGDGT